MWYGYWTNLRIVMVFVPAVEAKRRLPTARWSQACSRRSAPITIPLGSGRLRDFPPINRRWSVRPHPSSPVHVFHSFIRFSSYHHRHLFFFCHLILLHHHICSLFGFCFLSLLKLWASVEEMSLNTQVCTDRHTDPQAFCFRQFFQSFSMIDVTLHKFSYIISSFLLIFTCTVVNLW